MWLSCCLDYCALSRGQLVLVNAGDGHCRAVLAEYEARDEFQDV